MPVLTHHPPSSNFLLAKVVLLDKKFGAGTAGVVKRRVCGLESPEQPTVLSILHDALHLVRSLFQVDERCIKSECGR